MLDIATTGDRSVDQADLHGVIVFITGVVLIILGALLGIPILYSIGVILVVIGAILWLLGTMGKAVGGRSHYW